MTGSPWFWNFMLILTFWLGLNYCFLFSFFLCLCLFLFFFDIKEYWYAESLKFGYQCRQSQCDQYVAGKVQKIQKNAKIGWIFLLISLFFWEHFSFSFHHKKVRCFYRCVLTNFCYLYYSKIWSVRFSELLMCVKFLKTIEIRIYINKAM